MLAFGLMQIWISPISIFYVNKTWSLFPLFRNFHGVNVVVYIGLAFNASQDCPLIRIYFVYTGQCWLGQSESLVMNQTFQGRPASGTLMSVPVHALHFNLHKIYYQLLNAVHINLGRLPTTAGDSGIQNLSLYSNHLLYSSLFGREHQSSHLNVRG